jgi:hypothetical protein
MAGTTEERSGWVLFATTVFIVLGVFNVIYGLTMLLNDEWLVFTADTVWYINLTTWGWITLIIGLVQFLVAWGVANAELWARIIGVIAAALALIGAFVTIPYYPWWSITVMVLATFLIWAMTVHGSEVHETPPAAGTA